MDSRVSLSLMRVPMEADAIFIQLSPCLSMMFFNVVGIMVGRSWNISVAELADVATS